jgi:hypothetical protein
MLPFLIAAPDLEPETGRVGTVRLPYGDLLRLLGRPNLEASDPDGHVAWGFIGPGGGGFVLWGGDAAGGPGWALDEVESWSIGFSDEGAYREENRDLARRVFGDALEMGDVPPGGDPPRADRGHEASTPGSPSPSVGTGVERL